MITRDEIESALSELEDFSRYSPTEFFEGQTVNGLKFTEVDEGGELNDTNCQFVVVKVEKDDGSFKHIKFEGYYNSWEGTEWDGLVSIVEPEIVQKTVWNKLEE
jgi:hypothetical protein